MATIGHGTYSHAEGTGVLISIGLSQLDDRMSRDLLVVSRGLAAQDNTIAKRERDSTNGQAITDHTLPMQWQHHNHNY